MRRTFMLQMHDRPEGRAFTVTNDGQSVIEAVCRWCTAPVLLHSAADAERWASDQHIPAHVLDSLRAHFMKRPITVRVVPPPALMPQVTQGGIIQVKAGSAIQAGDVVTAADGVPIGIATTSVEAGGMLAVQLNSASLPEPPPEPSKSPFRQLLDDLLDNTPAVPADDDDEDRITGL